VSLKCSCSFLFDSELIDVKLSGVQHCLPEGRLTTLLQKRNGELSSQKTIKRTERLFRWQTHLQTAYCGYRGRANSTVHEDLKYHDRCGLVGANTLLLFPPEQRTYQGRISWEGKNHAHTLQGRNQRRQCYQRGKQPISGRLTCTWHTGLRQSRTVQDFRST